MKSWLQDNDIEMSSTHYEGKSVVTERFTITLKNIFYKYMTSASKNIYINKLDDVLNKYNKACHSAIKMKLVDVMSSNLEEEDPQFEFRDHVRMSKYKNIFAKSYVPNWPKEVQG